MELKVLEIGESYGVILPGEVAKALNARQGSTLTLVPNENGHLLSARDLELARQMRIARSLIRRYRCALADLAK